MTKDEEKQIGILIGTVEGINTRLDNFNGQIKDLTAAVASLPCIEHNFRLKVVEKVQENKILNSRLKKKLSSNLRSHVIGALIGAGITALVWCLIERLL